jgi:hypothetical protein
VERSLNTEIKRERNNQEGSKEIDTNERKKERKMKKILDTNGCFRDNKLRE